MIQFKILYYISLVLLVLTTITTPVVGMYAAWQPKNIQEPLTTCCIIGVCIAFVLMFAMAWFSDHKDAPQSVRLIRDDLDRLHDRNRFHNERLDRLERKIS